MLVEHEDAKGLGCAHVVQRATLALRWERAGHPASRLSLGEPKYRGLDRMFVAFISLEP